jgi:spore coat protein U-like protein
LRRFTPAPVLAVSCSEINRLAGKATSKPSRYTRCNSVAGAEARIRVRKANLKRSVIITLIACSVALTTTSMFATTVSSVNTNNVTATVIGGCQWITPLTMAFPNYDPFAGAATTQSTTVNFKCVKKTNATDTYKIWFSKTAGNMTSGVNTLAYTLTDAGGVALKTTAGTSTTVAGVAGVGAGSGYTFTVNGSIAAAQDVPTGAYVDTVVANIEY